MTPVTTTPAMPARASGDDGSSSEAPIDV